MYECHQYTLSHDVAASVASTNLLLFLLVGPFVLVGRPDLVEVIGNFFRLQS